MFKEVLSLSLVLSLQQEQTIVLKLGMMSPGDSSAPVRDASLASGAVGTGGFTGRQVSAETIYSLDEKFT